MSIWGSSNKISSNRKELEDIIKEIEAFRVKEDSSKFDNGGRTYLKKENLDIYLEDAGGDEQEVTFADDANLISSKLENGNHKPVIDLDLPCQLHPSSTEGHFHLYIDKELDWEQYEALLLVLADCGIIEQNYAEASIRRGFSAVRPPWVKKGDEQRKRDADAAARAKAAGGSSSYGYYGYS